LEEQRVTYDDLNEFLNFRRELHKYGISMGDTSKFLVTLSTINEMGSDASAIVSNYDKVRKFEAKEITVDELNKEINQLKEERVLLQEEVDSHRLAISTFKSLESMGFRLKELKRLRRTIREIADANEMPPDKAFEKFIADIEEQYDEKLGFESKLENLKSQIRKQQEAINNHTSSFNEIFSTLARISWGGREGQHGQLDGGAKFQGIDQVGETTSRQQAKNNMATGHPDELQGQTTNSNIADTGTSNLKNNIFSPGLPGKEEYNEEREQEELHLSDCDIVGMSGYESVTHNQEGAATATTISSKTIYKNLVDENLIEEAPEEQEQDNFTIYRSHNAVNFERILETVMQAKQKLKDGVEKAVVSDESATHET
jgi:hypothetical protein